ncbi:ATP-binding cassette domain-containing protein [Parvimonas sp.]|uniref:ATP-binding cassette domain-containing protein n=1 Tax=Parvimonas sp. TaxID=1944660 RepID=UPI00020DDDE5|nr:ATP-binding cassette domain-containing protein [Parvimonas sp.]EGL35854.1 hypothetical protein HMPREF9126_1572 [Parvimonas sp. oral taxon 110 str. F0139]MBF1295115.1 ATP-binding cassette domain-containing protein [Parvimonas sp.]MBF1299936.1 ATP-binding cassette domain-containing protein [Parvimonas sp.]
MIEIKNLKKNYGKFVAIDDFNLEIEEGKTYGILGRINSGGTTIFNILCNYTFKDDGTVLIDEKEPENARDLIYMCPKMEFYSGYTLRQILKTISDFNSDFDVAYALELCESFKLDLDKKFKVEENVQNCTIFKTIVTICMKKKYLLFNKPEIGLSSLDIRKLSDILMGNYKRMGYTPIIHSKNVNYFFDYLDYIIIIKDKKVVLFESRENLEKMVYSISVSIEFIDDIAKEKNILAVRDVKNFSKLKNVYILAKDEDEIKEHGSRTVSLKELYEAITASEGGH